jgi:alkylated DNA repair dioxygenase AlkB
MAQEAAAVIAMELALRAQGNSFRINRDSLDIEFWPDFLTRSKADALLSQLLTETPWQHADIVIYGRRVKMPRLTAWYGDPGATYTYSGLRNEPRPWTPALSELRREVETTAAHPFNSVLLNFYRSGDDYMSWHRDDEPELGPRPTIASATLGAARRFQFREVRPAVAGTRKTHEIELTHGSLLVMREETQQAWEHGIPKARGLIDPRINLTFRFVEPRPRQRG